MTDVFKAENYIWTNLASQYGGFSVVLLNPSSFPSVHFYNGTVADPDTGIITDAEAAKYMVAFGGAHRMMFVDFDAGPEHYTVANGGSNGLKPLWTLDLTSASGLAAAQTEMVGSVRLALEGRFTNSFLYTPFYHSALLFNVTIYSMDNSRSWSQYLNTGLLQTAFSELDPLSTILQPRVREIPGQSDQDFYNVLQSSRYSVQISATTSVTLYNNTMITDYIAHHLSKYASRNMILPDGSSVDVIPIVVVAGLENLDDLLVGVVGSALPGPDGSFGFIEAMTAPRLIAFGAGLSQTIIHETGHALGLSHPHDIYDNQFGMLHYWLNDFSSTPMSYCCAYFHYDTLAKDDLNQGFTATLFNRTLTLVKQGEQIYKTLGYGELPPQVLAEANLANSDMTNALSVFGAANPDYVAAATDALDAVHHVLNGINMLYNDLMSITYEVTDSQGQILVGARVQATLPNGTRILGRTWLAGKFGLTGLPWGNYTYVVTFEGTVVGSVFLKEEGSTTRTLQTGVTSFNISKEVSTDGDAINVPIMLIAPNGTMLSVNPGFSDSKVQNGTWTVSVSYQGINVYSNTVSLVSATVLNLSLSVSKISYSVTDNYGNPLANARIVVLAPNGTSLSLITDSSGVASLGLAAHGSYRATKVTWQGIEVMPSGQASTDLTKSISTTVKARVYNLSVQVSDILGLTISGVQVTLNHPNGTQLTATTNGAGVATFADVPDGQYSGSVSYLGQSTPLQISSGNMALGSSNVRLIFSPVSLGIFTVIPGLAIGAGVFLVRRRYNGQSKAGVVQQPGYVPGPAPQTPPQYLQPQYSQTSPPSAQLVPGQIPYQQPTQYPYQPGRYPAGQYAPPQTQPYPANQIPPQAQQPTQQAPPVQYQPTQVLPPQPFQTQTPAAPVAPQPVTPVPPVQTQQAPAPQVQSQVDQTPQLAQPPTPPQAQPPTQLPTSAPRQISPSTSQYGAQDRKMQFCPYCGTRVVEGAKFCHSCGKQF
jgi:hypothetical protein